MDRRYAYIPGLGTFHALASLDCDRTHARPLNVQDRPALRQKSGKLLALKLANFALSLGYREYGDSRVFAKMFDVIHLAVTHNPRNSLRNRRFGDAAKTGHAQRFD